MDWTLFPGNTPSWELRTTSFSPLLQEKLG